MLEKKRSKLIAEKELRLRRIERTSEIILNSEEESRKQILLSNTQAQELKVVQDTQNDWVKRLTQAFSDKVITRDSLAAYRSQQVEYQRQLSEIANRILDIEKNSAQYKHNLESQQIDDRQSIEEFDIQLIEVTNQQRQIQSNRSHDIIAATDGVVAAIGTATGSYVSVGDFLVATDDPSSKPIVVLEVPSKAIGSIKSGQEVVLKYDAYPFKTFGVRHGIVNLVSTAPQTFLPGSDSPSSSSQGHQNSKNTTFRVYVDQVEKYIEVGGRRLAFTIGSDVTAEITTERRTLINWILDPIKAPQGRS